MGSDGIVHVDAWKYIRVRVSLVEHIDRTGTEVLVEFTAVRRSVPFGNRVQIKSDSVMPVNKMT